MLGSPRTGSISVGSEPCGALARLHGSFVKSLSYRTHYCRLIALSSNLQVMFAADQPVLFCRALRELALSLLVPVQLHSTLRPAYQNRPRKLPRSYSFRLVKLRVLEEIYSRASWMKRGYFSGSMYNASRTNVQNPEMRR